MNICSTSFKVKSVRLWRGNIFILRSAPEKETLRRTELESLCEIYLRYMYGKSQSHPICQAGLENKFVKPEQLDREMGPFRNTEFLWTVSVIVSYSGAFVFSPGCRCVSVFLYFMQMRVCELTGSSDTSSLRLDALDSIAMLSRMHHRCHPSIYSHRPIQHFVRISSSDSFTAVKLH